MARIPRLTLFGRSLALISGGIIFNIVLWIVAAILFARDPQTQPVLGLALLAWTLGLRHALDADHISAIDNATRGLISKGQLPVTCGLFFSIGHSTIVIVVNVAIAISSDVYNRISGVGEVGGIVGAAVSGGFLFIVGLANSIILWRTIQQRRKRLSETSSNGPPDEESQFHEHHTVLPGEALAHPPDQKNRADNHDSESRDAHLQGHTLMLRILGPILSFVDRPWKMYPVGVLFGFGFDTASSIALLAVSAMARKGTDGKPIPQAYIVILPFLFTAGMTLIDSLDSVLMIYSYAGFPERGWSVVEGHWAHFELSRGNKLNGASNDASSPQGSISAPKPDPSRVPFGLETSQEDSSLGQVPQHGEEASHSAGIQVAEHDDTIRKQDSDGGAPYVDDLSYADDNQETALNADESIADDKTKRRARRMRTMRVKQNMMSGLSIVLTLMSILVAFSISLITIMGLIGEQCRPCREAAEADDGHGGGLAGRWWRGWAKANDNSGYIGAAIVGSFILIVCTWYSMKRFHTKHGSRN